MNKVTRRQFLKSSAILGTTTSSIGFGKQPTSANTGIEIKQTMTPPVEVYVLQTLENNNIKVQILSNAEIRVSDKINQQQWQTFKVAIQDETVIRESQLWGRGGRSMGEQYPGRFVGGREGEKLRFRLFGRQNVYEGSFVCTFILKKEWLSLQITEIDDSLPSLVFPPPFECDTLVLPNEGGKLLKNESSSIYSGIYRREFLQFFNSLGMRFVGGLNGNNGWLCAYDTKSVDAGAMMINGHITPAWIRSMGNWQGHYQVNYSFTGNGYMGIAKRYRQYAIENGFYKSLKEKIEANPGVEKLLGGRALQFMNYKGKGYDSIKDDYWAIDKQIETYKNEYVNFTFKEVMEKIKLAE